MQTQFSAAEQSRLNGFQNRLAVWSFFIRNPCHTQRECASALALSEKTVARHAKAIRGGWRPGDAWFAERIIDHIDAADRRSIKFAEKANQTFPIVITAPNDPKTEAGCVLGRIFSGVIFDD